MTNEPILAMAGITKRFPGVIALDDVSFSVTAGEVHSLVGENGAGKSTLMKVLGGAYQPDSGSIVMDGTEITMSNPMTALKAGISVIYQEFNLVPTLTVSENIHLGSELRTRTGTIDRRRMVRDSQEIIDRFGFRGLDSRRMVADLSVAQQQIVEIVRSLFHNSRIVVMDEPTAVLTDRESETLFALIEKLREHGVAVVYISHRLDEVTALSDRITVMRDGRRVVELDNSRRDVTKETIVRHMVGRELNSYYPPREPYVPGPAVLEVSGLSRHGMFNDITFSLRKGEILGFFGLVGAGRTEVMKTIYGDLQPDAGSIKLAGQPVRIRSPREAIDKGIALVPEDRKSEGLVLVRSLSDNLALPNPRMVSRFGIVSGGRKSAIGRTQVAELQIRPGIVSRPAQDFSGGNQQKIVLGKWLLAGSSIIIMDEPTRGIDVGAKLEIYTIINDLTTKGMGIIIVSSELLEVLGICDRVLVMHEGRLVGEFDARTATQEQVVAAASGM